MTKEEKQKEFIRRLSMELSRFNISHKFHRIDSATAKLQIAHMACQLLEQMSREKEDEQEPVETIIVEQPVIEPPPIPPVEEPKVDTAITATESESNITTETSNDAG